MGVPGFVAWLYKNHKKTNLIFKDLFKTSAIENNLNTSNILEDQYFYEDIRVDSIQHLLIDTNCLIHPQARLVCLDNSHLI